MASRMPQFRSVSVNFVRVMAMVAACAACHVSRSEPAPSPAADSLLDEYSLRQWTVEDGLPERMVQCVDEGPDGYLWVATFRHLLRFDGMRFVDAGSPGPDFDADPGERILRMHAATDGRVYLLTSEGVRCHGSDGWTRLLQRSPNDDPSEWRAAALTGDSQGIVHLGGDAGIVTFLAGAIATPSDDSATTHWAVVGGVPHAVVGGELEPHPVSDQDRSERVVQFSVSNDVPTVVTMTAIHRWADGAWETIADRPPETLCALVDRSGGLWCGGEQGIREYRRGRWAALEIGAAPVNVAVRSLLEDSGGTIWAATDGGLIRFRQRTRGVRVIPVAGPLPGVKAAWQADDGTIWAAPERGGLVRLRPGDADQGFEPVALPGAAAALRFEAILVGTDGEIWLGTDGAGLWHGRPGDSFARIPAAADGRRLSMVATLAGDPRKRLWIGSGEGLFLLDPAAAPRPAAEPNTAVRLVEAIVPDTDGTLWIGRQGDWITQVDADGETLRRLDAVGQPQGSVGAFHRDRRGTLWAGGNPWTPRGGHHPDRGFAVRTALGGHAGRAVRRRPRRNRPGTDAARTVPQVRSRRAARARQLHRPDQSAPAIHGTPVSFRAGPDRARQRRWRHPPQRPTGDHRGGHGDAPERHRGRGHARGVGRAGRRGGGGGTVHRHPHGGS